MEHVAHWVSGLPQALAVGAAGELMAVGHGSGTRRDEPFHGDRHGSAGLLWLGIPLLPCPGVK